MTDEITPARLRELAQRHDDRNGVGDPHGPAAQLDLLAEETAAALRAAADQLTPKRVCVVCGDFVDAVKYKRGDNVDGCPAYGACTLDMTDAEAWQHWRKKAHTLTATLAEREALLRRAAEALGPFVKADSAIQQVDPDYPEHGAALRASFDYFAMITGDETPETIEMAVKRRAVSRGDLRAVAALAAEIAAALGGKTDE